MKKKGFPLTMKMSFCSTAAALVASIFLNGCCCFETPEVPKNTQLKLIQMCDPQLGFQDYDGELKRFEEAVAFVNKETPDFVVICGDIVHLKDDKSYADAKTTIDKLAVPYFAAPGNHDIGGDHTVEDRARFAEKIGPDYGSFVKNGYRIVIVDTQLWQKAPAELTAEMDEFVLNELKAAKANGEKLIVAGHVPLYVNTVDEKDEYFNIPAANGKRQELLALFQEYDVLAYLSGHTHTAFATVNDGLLMSAGETTGVRFDGLPPGVRVFNFNNDQANFRSKFFAK